MKFDESRDDEFHHLRSHLTVIKGHVHLAHREVTQTEVSRPRVVQHLVTASAHIDALADLVIKIEARLRTTDAGGNG